MFENIDKDRLAISAVTLLMMIVGLSLVTLKVSSATVKLIEPLAKIAAPPDWVPIPNQQYNMQIIGEIVWAGMVSTNPNDIVGAFVGDECRGVANPVASLGVFFLTVGSNQQSGEDVTFKVYHSGLDLIDDNPQYTPVVFESLGLIGTLNNPFTIESLLPTEVEVELVPAEYNLYQNYPNPFNPVTNIKFELPEPAKISIMIYNSLGELVTEVVNQDFDAGYHKVEFNANNYASGVYIYRLVSKNFVDTKKMLMIK